LYPGAQEKGKAAALSPDGRLAAVGDSLGEVRVWDPASDKEIRRWKAHQGPVLSAAFSPDGTILATGGDDQLLKLWEVSTGQELRQLKGHEKGVSYVIFSPTGTHLASGVGDETIHLWEVSTGNQIRQLAEQGAEVLSVAFSVDGKMLAAGSNDGNVRLWDLATGRTERELTGHPGYVMSVAFSPDGRTLAAGSWLSARLWEIETGKERGRLDGQYGDVMSLAFAPDGKTLAAGNGGTTVLTWDITGRLSNGRLPAVKLTTAELESLWKDLAGEDGLRAYRATWAFVAGGPDSVSFLRARLQPVPPLDGLQHKRIVQLTEALDSEDFSVRERATADLEKLGDTAGPALRKVLRGQPSSEVRTRAEGLLEKLQSPALVRERVRVRRADEVLELMASAEARQLLHSLAQGEPESGLTQDARAALQRIEKRGLP
jgi:predicted NACHT family NTPase